MMLGIQATANWLSHSNCLDIFTSLLKAGEYIQTIQFNLACY